MSMVRLDAGNSLYRGTGAGSGATTCFWVYVFATGRTATYIDSIPGPDVVVGHDTALTYITFGSWDHDAPIPA